MPFLTLFLFSDITKYMRNSDLHDTFVIGESVFYPSVGVCRIEKIEIRNDNKYLKLYDESSDSTILIPVVKAKDLGLRHLAKKEELLDAFKVLGDYSTPIEPDWKKRLLENQTLIKQGSIDSITKVVSTLYRRSKVRSLPSVEKRLYDNAINMLVDESSYVLNKDVEEIRKIIFSYLENANSLFPNSDSSR